MVPLNFHKIEIQESLVDALKEKFLDEVKQSEDGTYDPRDVERIRSGEFNHWWVKRFILIQKVDYHKAEVEAEIIPPALEHMKKVYRWRKAQGVNDLYEKGPGGSGLREEAFTTGEVHAWKLDANGNLVFISRLLTNSTAIYDAAYMAPIMWLLETLDREAARRETMIQFIGDMRSAGLKNFSCHQPFVINEAVNSIAVGHLTGCLILGMPFILKPIWKVVSAFLSGESVRNLTHGTEKDMITIMGSEDQVPGYLQAKPSEISGGGIPWRVRPAGTQPLDAVAKAEGVYEANIKGVNDYLDLKAKLIEKLEDKSEAVIKSIGGTSQDYLNHFLN